MTKFMPLGTAITVVLTASPAYAQWFWQRQPQGYNLDVPATPIGNIDRPTFNRINQAGGGVDQNGYYRQPVPPQPYLGHSLSRDGIYRSPMQWDPDRSVLYQVQQGNIIRQDYQYPYEMPRR